MWPPHKRWLSKPPSLPTQLIHSHSADENLSHSWAPASGYHLLPSIWLLFTNSLVVPPLSPRTLDSDDHFFLPPFSWSVSMSVPMTPSNQLSSQLSNLFDARDQHHTPDPSWISSVSSYFPVMDSQTLGSSFPSRFLNPFFPALHLLGHMKNTNTFYFLFIPVLPPLCFLFLICISLSPRSSWMYHLSPGMRIVVPCEENTMLSSFQTYPLLFHLRVLAQLERSNKHMWWHICGPQLDADPCFLSQPHKIHFKFPPVSSMPWLAILPTTFYRWLKSEFTREQWPSDQQLCDFLTLSQGLYVSYSCPFSFSGKRDTHLWWRVFFPPYLVPISSCVDQLPFLLSGQPFISLFKLEH